ncbi:retrovirus-related pol polyprotein from transposon TNT 1-94, partial [Tanacetum coccineum]
KVIHTLETDIVKLVVEIESFGMSSDEFDKETVLVDELQLRQADISCVHALDKLHLHEIRVVSSMKLINDQVLSILSNFLAYIGNYFDAKPKFLRSDNGTEIVNILGRLLLTATYLINKMPMKVLEWKTHFEMLHGVLPSYEQLRVIGCLCFATITKPHKDKFSPKSIRSVLIGYPPGQKGYKFYSLETHKVFCSRDVIFHETVFPFKKDKSTNESSLPAQQWPSEMGAQNDEDVPNVVPKITTDTTTENVVPNTPEESTNTPIVEEPNPSTTTNQVPITRKSSRSSTQPAWLKDFVTSKHKAGMAAADIS